MNFNWARMGSGSRICSVTLRCFQSVARTQLFPNQLKVKSFLGLDLLCLSTRNVVYIRLRHKLPFQAIQQTQHDLVKPVFGSVLSNEGFSESLCLAAIYMCWVGQEVQALGTNGRTRKDLFTSLLQIGKSNVGPLFIQGKFRSKKEKYLFDGELESHSAYMRIEPPISLLCDTAHSAEDSFPHRF